MGGEIGAVTRGHTLERLDVEDAGLRRDADGESCAGSDGSGGERGGLGPVALLVLWRAVIARSGESSLVDLG